MKNPILTVAVVLGILAAGCERPPAPEGAGRATSAPNSHAQDAKGEANTTKAMGAAPVNPGAEKAPPKAQEPTK